MDKLLATMRERLRPTPAERGRLDAAATAIGAKARDVAAAFRKEGSPTFEPLLVGSAAKDTWIHGKVDLDLFLLFPPALPRDRLESLGLRAGHEILPSGIQRYAEHPYVHGGFDGLPADVVPAYKVASAALIQSAVDRTPFHNQYVIQALAREPGLKDEIRLFKAWLRGIGTYGAETSLGGVSGYLAEVLVLHCGGFLATLSALARLPRGGRMDPTGGSSARFPQDALIVIDPVDPERNVASAVRVDRFDVLQQAIRAFLAAPSERFFSPAPLATPSRAQLDRVLEGGGAAFVTLPLPVMREDAVAPHLKRAAQGLAAHLARDGFAIGLSDGMVDAEKGVAVLLVASRERELPAEREHLGPPLDVVGRVDEFRRKYVGHPDVVRGPYDVDDNGRRRSAVLLRVHDRGLVARVRSALARPVSLGKHIDEALARGPVHVVDALDALSDPRLAPLVAAAFCPRPAWERSGDAALDYRVAPRSG